MSILRTVSGLGLVSLVIIGGAYLLNSSKPAQGPDLKRVGTDGINFVAQQAGGLKNELTEQARHLQTTTAELSEKTRQIQEQAGQLKTQATELTHQAGTLSKTAGQTLGTAADTVIDTTQNIQTRTQQLASSAIANTQPPLPRAPQPLLGTEWKVLSQVQDQPNTWRITHLKTGKQYEARVQIANRVKTTTITEIATGEVFKVFTGKIQ